MREAVLPSFHKNMTFKERVTELLQEGLKEKTSIFLIDMNIDGSNKISITLDGDYGITLQDCIDISKSIDQHLDREEVDFSLEVASCGVSSPLKLIRQYKKNVGRTLKVKTETEKIEALLEAADDDKIVLTWSAREPKKIGKGKETVVKTVEIPYQEIKEAVVTINFN